MQRAFDNSAQRKLLAKVNSASEINLVHDSKPLVQAIFCIDVRSEIFRRNLELVSPAVHTFGFAGFFAFPIKFIPIGHDSAQNLCPVLIPAKATVTESLPDKSSYETAVKKRSVKHQVDKAWNSFKKGAVTCFSFMGPVGLSYLPKLYSDSFGLTRPVEHPASEGLGKKYYAKRDVSLEITQHGNITVGINTQEQIEMAKSALEGMSLTYNFARLVLITGHRSSSVNNPHATGLDCGACGGHTGEANARVAAKVLNNPEVRKGLALHNLMIPDETLFIAGLHDTTTDTVILFNEEKIPDSHRIDILKLKQWLARAGEASRIERSLRLSSAGHVDHDKNIFGRSRDWSQVRPEWGLAGCNSFIVARRKRTQSIDLGGKSFLHDYDYKQDKELKVLELIMTAPMVVANWINMQYYASVVDNKNFGSGNKALHNVTGGIGVIEGHSGDLRTGLPWQSVHDGNEFQHLPQRLNVIIEAPTGAMNEILKKHEVVKDLCDNGWINLLAMNEYGLVTYRYLGLFNWENLHTGREEALVA